MTTLLTNTTASPPTNNNNNGMPSEYTPAAWEYADLDARMGLYGGVFAGCGLIFTLCLFATHRFFSSPTNTLCPPYLRQVYLKLPGREQADWCSRVNSTIHAVVVCIAFPWTLADTEWSSYPVLLPLDSKAVEIRCIMALASAYFVVDTFVIAIFRVPLYGVFLLHHFAAMIPLLNNVFNTEANCRRATFDMALFLLVELCTLFVNFQSWMETCKVKTVYKKTYVAMVYGVFFSWIPLRICLPLFIMVHLYRTIILADGVITGCMYLPLVCAHFITLFCLVVFFGLFFPQMMKRWFGSGPLPEDIPDKDDDAKDEGTAPTAVTSDANKTNKDNNNNGNDDQNLSPPASPVNPLNDTTKSRTKSKTPPNVSDPLLGDSNNAGAGAAATGVARNTSFRDALLEEISESLLQVATSGHI